MSLQTNCPTLPRRTYQYKQALYTMWEVVQNLVKVLGSRVSQECGSYLVFERVDRVIWRVLHGICSVRRSTLLLTSAATPTALLIANQARRTCRSY